MTRYADPTRCPDCHANLPVQPASCPACGLALNVPQAIELFETLVRADDLLAQMRATVTVPAPAVPAAPVIPASPTTPAHQPYPTTTPAPTSTQTPTPAPAGAVPTDKPARTGLSGASVPKILLGLGALCLLVAAIVFLAVAWSILGVGGRTAVLVTMTIASLAAGLVFDRRGLRFAAEIFTVVGLGLLLLDLVGAESSGWLGGLGLSGLQMICGVALTGVALALVLVTRGEDASPLVGAQLLAPAGVLLALAGATDHWNHHRGVVATLATVAALALAVFAQRGPRRLVPLWVAGLSVATLSWLALLGNGLQVALDDYDLPHLVGQLGGGPLLTSAVLLGGAGFLIETTPLVRRAMVGAALAIVNVLVLIPTLDTNSWSIAVMVSAGLVVLWALVALLTGNPWRRLMPVPLVTAAVLPALGGAALLSGGIQAIYLGEPLFAAPLDAEVVDVFLDINPPVGVLAVAALLLANAALARLLPGKLRKRQWLALPVLVLAAAAVAAVAHYDVPLALVLGLLVAIAAGFGWWAARRDTTTGFMVLSTVTILLLTAATAAAVNAAMTVAVMVVMVALAAWLLGHPSVWVKRFATAALPLTGAWLVWAGCEWGGLDERYRAIPILVLGGLAAIRWARLTVEVPVAVASIGASAAAIDATFDDGLSLALHLTVAGVLVVISSLVNADRRLLGWLGGLLLAGATWVRLWDVGVRAPEAYTMPSALALLAVGLWHLKRNPSVSTMRALSAGLTLATVPSLLRVFGSDPVTIRALLLGIGCLLLIMVGVRFRWTAPIIIGSVVGALLALYELVPYLTAIPPWIAIGLAGALLTTVGVTWESRMRNLRTAGAYLEKLR